MLTEHSGQSISENSPHDPVTHYISVRYSDCSLTRNQPRDQRRLLCRLTNANRISCNIFFETQSTFWLRLPLQIHNKTGPPARVLLLREVLLYRYIYMQRLQDLTSSPWSARTRPRSRVLVIRRDPIATVTAIFAP